MEKHFVTFYSPGPLFAEDTTKSIDSWDVDVAMKMADAITERHNATPYGFRFTTRTRGPDDFHSKESACSGLYFLGGKIETAEEIIARNAPDEEILRSNIEANGCKRIVTNSNSWKWTMPLGDNDVVLDYVAPRDRK